MLGDHTGGLEAEVELGRGLDVAAAGDGGLDDALADGDRAAGGGLGAGGGPDDEHGGDDRADAERSRAGRWARAGAERGCTV